MDNETQVKAQETVESQETSVEQTSQPASQGTEGVKTQDGAQPVTQQDDSTQKLRQTAFKEAGEWKRKYRDLEGRFNDFQSRYMEQLENLNRNRASEGKSPVNQLPPEQAQALNQLADMLLNNPEIREKYGLNRAEKLEQELNSLRSSNSEKTFNNEAEKSIEKYSKLWGMDPVEMEQEVAEFLENDPVFSKIPYSEGSYERAMKACYFDRLDEMKSRAANLKLIEEQKKKKGGNLEGSSKGNQGSTKPSEKGMFQFLERRASELFKDS